MSKCVDLCDMTSGWVGIRGDTVIKPNDGFYYKTREACVKQMRKWDGSRQEYYVPASVNIVQIFITINTPPAATADLDVSDEIDYSGMGQTRAF